jgi:hypothetical protein
MTHCAVHLDPLELVFHDPKNFNEHLAHTLPCKWSGSHKTAMTTSLIQFAENKGIDLQAREDLGFSPRYEQMHAATTEQDLLAVIQRDLTSSTMQRGYFQFKELGNATIMAWTTRVKGMSV